MKRLKLLAAIAALAAVLAAAVVLGSPYEPVVGPCREIEELWAIEDEREESAEPLVTALSNQGVPLAYDAQANTFYCTLGLGHGEAWPDIHLTAPGAGRGLTLCFSDDYAFDWCGEAIAEGYAYQVMAYTDTEYAYFDIVFTGLPIISVQSQQEITGEDSPVHVTMSAYGEEALSSSARMHVRGASTFLAGKSGYKIEFTRREDGTKKVSWQVPGFGVADDIVLLALNYDDTKMRDRLSWDIYAQMAEEEESFGPRRTGYVELFVNGEYAGLYLMLEPYDIETELEKSGEMHALTDGVYRTAALNFSRDRLYREHPKRGNMGFELFYTQAAEGHEFDLLSAYMDLVYEEDDGQFAEKALACMDIDSIVRMEMLVQGGGMTDNFYNNLYVWASPKGQGGVTYRFAPWDMDLTWGLKKEDIGGQFENWMFFKVFDRMTDLNVGNIRVRMNETWKEMRETIFNEENIARRLEQYEKELSDSGAMARDAERWDTGMYVVDSYEIIAFCTVRFPMLDEVFERLAESPDEPVDFLSALEYEGKAVPMIEAYE